MKNKIIPIFAIISIISTFFQFINLETVLGEFDNNFWQACDAVGYLSVIILIIGAAVNLGTYFLMDIKEISIIHIANPAANVIACIMLFIQVKNYVDPNMLESISFTAYGWLFLVVSVVVGVIYFKNIGSAGNNVKADSISMIR